MTFRRRKSREVISSSNLPRFLEKIQFTSETKEFPTTSFDQYLLFKDNFTKTLPAYQKFQFPVIGDDFRLENNKVIPFTLEQLIILNTIVRFGTFKTAAEKLYMSQAAISLQIKRLENKLNICLFERTKKNLRLTLPGSILLYYIDRILFLCDEVSKLLLSANIPHKDLYKERYLNFQMQNNLLLSKKKLKDSSFSKFRYRFFSREYSIYSLQRKKTNIILRRIRQFLQVKKEFELVSFTLDNFTFLIKKEFEFSFLKLIQLQNLDEHISFLYLTDELLFPSDCNVKEVRKPFHNLTIFENNYSLEVNSMEAFIFCLKTELAGCFFFENSSLKRI